MSSTRKKACRDCLHRKSCSSTNDVILVPEQANTIQIEWNTSKRTPEEEIERSVKILRRFKGIPESNELTVGDLSNQAEEKRKHRLAYAARLLENVERGLTVGSLYGTPNPHIMIQSVKSPISEEARREIEAFDRIKRQRWRDAELRSIVNREG